MKKIYALLFCSMAVMAASPAVAQDYGDEDNNLPDTPADIFSGPHIELSVGLDHLGIKAYNALNPGSDVSATKTGLSYGGALGYDVPLTEHLTLGGEFGLTTSTNKWANPGLVTGTFNTANVNAGRDISVGVRLGYAFTTKTQVFGKLAFTNTHFGVSGTDGSEVLYEGIAANGVRLGVGVEHHLTRALYVKLEYDRSQYGSGGFNYSGATPDASSYVLHDGRDQLMGSVGLRF